MKPNFDKQELIVFDSSRGLLALLVVLAHIAQVIWYPIVGLGGLSTIMGTVANIAVVIFFFLSGMLITYSAANLTNNKGFNYKRYFINRLTRIYPTLIFSLCLVFILMKLFPFFNAGTFNIEKLPTDLYHVRDKYYVAPFQIIKTVTLLITDIVNINGPMWSLFIEWWLYISAMFLFIGLDNIGRPLWIRIISFITFLLPLIYIYRCFGVSGVFYIVIWFLGAIFTLIIHHKKAVKITLLIISVLIVLVLVLIKGTFILNIAKSDPLYFGFVQIVFTLFYLNFFMEFKFLKWVKAFAPFSYTLYLIHFPIILFVYAILRLYVGNNSFLLIIESFFVFALVIAVSFMSAKITEDKKFFRDIFKKNVRE